MKFRCRSVAHTTPVVVVGSVRLGVQALPFPRFAVYLAAKLDVRGSRAWSSGRGATISRVQVFEEMLQKGVSPLPRVYGLLLRNAVRPGVHAETPS